MGRRAVSFALVLLESFAGAPVFVFVASTVHAGKTRWVMPDSHEALRVGSDSWGYRDSDGHSVVLLFRDADSAIERSFGPNQTALSRTRGAWRIDFRMTESPRGLCSHV